MVFADNSQFVLIDDQFGGHAAVEGKAGIDSVQEGNRGKRTISPEGVFISGVRQNSAHAIEFHRRGTPERANSGFAKIQLKLLSGRQFID